MSNCENCLSPGCSCFRCELRPITMPQTATRIKTLEAQLAVQRKIVAAGDKYRACILYSIGGVAAMRATSTPGSADAWRCLLIAREAAALLDKETKDE